MLKSIHPLTRLFWVALVIGAIVYQLNKTDYPGPDAYYSGQEEVDRQELFMSENTCHLPVIVFDEGSNQLDMDDYEELHLVGQLMVNNPNMWIEIAGKEGRHEGHHLAENRERAVYKFLVKTYNILPRRLKIDKQDHHRFEHANHHEGHKKHHKHHRGHYDDLQLIDHHNVHIEWHQSTCGKKQHVRIETITESNSDENIFIFEGCNKRKSCRKAKTHELDRSVYLTCHMN
ncbi:MAG: hypothetical protein AAFY71_05920 [Bacteroidota bacterium]